MSIDNAWSAPFWTIAKRAAEASAEAAQIRIEMGFDRPPIQAPFRMEQILPDGDTLYVPGCPGDLREAKRRRGQVAAERGVPESHISLTDRNGTPI